MKSPFRRIQLLLLLGASSAALADPATVAREISGV